MLSEITSTEEEERRVAARLLESVRYRYRYRFQVAIVTS